MDNGTKEKLDDGIERIEQDISWIKTFGNIAREMQSHSKCTRLKVGSVIVKNRRIISTGYNGSPKGMHHCSDYFTEDDCEQDECPLGVCEYEMYNPLICFENYTLYATREAAESALREITGKGGMNDE